MAKLDLMDAKDLQFVRNVFHAGVNRGLEESARRRRERLKPSRTAIIKKTMREFDSRILFNLLDGKTYFEKRPKAKAAKAGK